MKLQHSCLLITAMALLAGCSKSSDNSGGDGTGAVDWNVRRDEIRRQARELAGEMAAVKVTPEAIAAQLGMPWPLPVPEPSVAEIKQQITNDVNHALREKYPESRLDQIRATLDSQASIYNIGDEVAFTIRGGKGPNSDVQGVFEDKTSTRLKIGGRWVLTSDMTKADLARFDPQVRTTVLETEYRRQKFIFEQEREKFARQLASRLLTEKLSQAGYHAVAGEWLAPAEIVDKELVQQRQQVAKELWPEVEDKLFPKAGFVMKQGEWEPSRLKHPGSLFD